MIVTCPGCSSNYRVRNESVPEGGAKMRCPKCQTMFLAVAPPGSEGPPAADPPPPSATTAPEPISGIFDLSTLRAPTPGDQIPFANTRPSGAMPKLEPPGLSSFPPTKIPPAVLPPTFGAPSSTGGPGFPVPPSSTGPLPSTSGPGFAAPPSSNPFLSGAQPSGAPAPWTSPQTPAHELAGVPRAAHPASSMSLPDLAAQMQGRTPSLQPPTSAPSGIPTTSSIGGPFSPPPATSPFSGGFTPSASTPFGQPASAPLPPRHPQGGPQRTSSLVGVLGADLFPSRPPEGPTLPQDPNAPVPRSNAFNVPPTGNPMRSDAPSTAVDPFAAAMTPTGPRSTPGVPRAALADSAARESPKKTGEVPRATRPVAETPVDVKRPARPSAVLSLASWLALSLGVLLVLWGGLFSGWAASLVDLDRALLPALERRFEIAPPRSFTGKDDVSVEELTKIADAARARGDLVAEGVALRRARAAAPLDDALGARLTRVLNELKAPPHLSR